MLVLKFGGTSMGTPEALDKVIKILSDNRKNTQLVVVSALSKVTDSLIEISRLAASADASYPEKVEPIPVLVLVNEAASWLNDDVACLAQRISGKNLGMCV